MKLSSARTILPVLMLVCLFSLIIRGVEVWTGVKSMGGVAFAVENTEEPPAIMSEEIAQATDVDEPTLTIEEEGTDQSETGQSIEEEVIEELSDFDEVTSIQAELAQDLVKQRKRLEARESELLQKEALLQAAEQELDRKYQELVALRQDIEDLLVTQSEEEDARIWIKELKENSVYSGKIIKNENFDEEVCLDII